MKKSKLSLLSVACVSATLLASTHALAAGGGEKHFPGIFVGATSFDGETEMTLGIEYEFKFSNMWGAGFVYEKTDEAHHGDGTTVVLLSAYAHPWKMLRLGVGLGEEEVGGCHPHTESLVRVSASYDFHVGDFGLAPTLAFDSIDGETATVFGVALIKAF